MGIATTSRGLAKYFSSRVREKGATYFARRRVIGLGGGAVNASAEVRGDSGNYEVFGSVQEDNPSYLSCSCDCPYATREGLPCKHIWAFLLAADERGLLTGYPGTAVKRLLLNTEDFEDDADDDEYMNDFLQELPGKQQPIVQYIRGRIRGRRPAPQPPREPAWKSALRTVAPYDPHSHQPDRGGWGTRRDVVYVIDRQDQNATGLKLQLLSREMKKDGTWGKPRNGSPSRHDLAEMPSADRDVLVPLFGAETQGFGYGYSSTSQYTLNQEHCRLLLPRLAATGKFYSKDSANPDLVPLAYENGDPWVFEVAPEKTDGGKDWRIVGRLVRGQERLALGQFDVLWPVGVVLRQNNLALADFRGAFAWVRVFFGGKELTVPGSQLDDFLAEAFAKGEPPPLRIPAEAGIAVREETMRPKLIVKKPAYTYRSDLLRADLIFRYGETGFATDNGRAVTFDKSTRAIVLRDHSAERAAEVRLHTLGMKPPTYYDHFHTVPSKRLPEIVRTLIAEGWQVEAEGKLYRTAGKFELGVATGIDWFELRGQVDFNGKVVALPQILEAIRNRQTMVDLGDGEMGLLPEEWLKKYALLAGAGEKKKDHVRFGQNQVGLLDALLAAQPEVDLDDKFRAARDLFRSFKGVEAAKPPRSFTGELRPYQAEGLGWLKFLRDFRFGGCLADDMGLGKTVQVLALLVDRAEARPAGIPRPSLVVVPKSLVFNWKAEAARFAPSLKVLDYTGTERKKNPSALGEYDVVLTTYGTLRNDAPLLKDIPFDYGILDESQAIKNAGTESAKACRLLNVRNPLAMSGTPIENHLGELWSLFDFLNPGMLGRATAFQLIGGSGRGADEESRAVLAHALRPYILRRTKDQVAKDLPRKTEQTVLCELEPAQRKVYNDLKEYYRKAILGAVETVGLAKAKIQILEALLRLRQAACHPGLLDKTNSGETSAKLDALLPQLGEVFEEGHKALVFSQFTSFLAIVKQRLDADGIPYEYLDGKTRNRQAKVDRFQTDPDCKLFLISLKAGGVGLNLTAAEYVFLLDPWWNPAVEAQAVDRAHRIGQTKPVFAYRYIAKDTVEEKVLALQESKKALADSIINADNSLIRSLKKEDLELLLS
ncbi:MAG TPA: DEAD/DEAH box helicase [Fimbriiglobus sp.]|jgi:superfamily II DNA or RNA helicase